LALTEPVSVNQNQTNNLTTISSGHVQYLFVLVFPIAEQFTDFYSTPQGHCPKQLEVRSSLQQKAIAEKLENLPSASCLATKRKA
jgi:hypothetical protein